METPRRTFLKYSGLAGLSLLLSSCQEKDTPEETSVSRVFPPEEGETWYIGFAHMAKVTILVSRTEESVPGMSLLTELIPPGDGIPEHRHLNEDEFIWIQSGSALVKVGEREVKLEPGGMAYVSRGTWHGLRNKSTDPVIMFFGYTPSGFEDYFRAIGVKDPDRRLQFSGQEWELISRRYGVEFR